MSKDRDDRPRGIAHVDFEDAKSLRIALNLDGNDFVGRSLRVDVAENKRASLCSPARTQHHTGWMSRWMEGRGAEQSRAAKTHTKACDA